MSCNVLDFARMLLIRCCQIVGQMLPEFPRIGRGINLQNVAKTIANFANSKINKIANFDPASVGAVFAASSSRADSITNCDHIQRMKKVPPYALSPEALLGGVLDKLSKTPADVKASSTSWRSFGQIVQNSGGPQRSAKSTQTNTERGGGGGGEENSKQYSESAL